MEETGTPQRPTTPAGQVELDCLSVSDARDNGHRARDASLARTGQSCSTHGLTRVGRIQNCTPLQLRLIFKGALIGYPGYQGINFSANQN